MYRSLPSDSGPVAMAFATFIMTSTHAPATASIVIMCMVSSGVPPAVTSRGRSVTWSVGLSAARSSIRGVRIRIAVKRLHGPSHVEGEDRRFGKKRQDIRQPD